MEGDPMNMHTPLTAKLLAVAGIAALGLLLLMAAWTSAYAGQATNPVSSAVIQPFRNPLAASARQATGTYTWYVRLPLVSSSTVGTATPTEGALFLNRTKKTYGAKVAVDASGGVHMSY